MHDTSDRPHGNPDPNSPHDGSDSDSPHDDSGSDSPCATSGPEGQRTVLESGGKVAGGRGVHAARNVREYTKGEEIANSVTHGIGAVLSVVGLVVLIVTARAGGGGVKLATGIFFGITLILEYTNSTLYHAFTGDTVKRVFKVLDHSSIYLLIVGTYAPFCFVALGNSGGPTIFAIELALALVGIGFEAFWVFRPRWVNAIIYCAMGWFIVFKIGTLIAVCSQGAVVLLLVGGACYTVGIIFYVLKKVPYMHSIWHLWTLAGSICHFLAVVLFLF